MARAFNNPAESALTPQTVPPAYFANAATWSMTPSETMEPTSPFASPKEARSVHLEGRAAVENAPSLYLCERGRCEHPLFGADSYNFV